MGVNAVMERLFLNLKMERFWRSVKYEWVYLEAYDAVGTARADITDYFGWYNSQRSHSSLDMVTPGKAHLDKQSKQVEAESKIAA